MDHIYTSKFQSVLFTSSLCLHYK